MHRRLMDWHGGADVSLAWVHNLQPSQAKLTSVRASGLDAGIGIFDERRNKRPTVHESSQSGIVDGVDNASVLPDVI